MRPSVDSAGYRAPADSRSRAWSSLRSATVSSRRSASSSRRFDGSGISASVAWLTSPAATRRSLAFCSCPFAARPKTALLLPTATSALVRRSEMSAANARAAPTMSTGVELWSKKARQVPTPTAPTPTRSSRCLNSARFTNLDSLFMADAIVGGTLVASSGIPHVQRWTGAGRSWPWLRVLPVIGSIPVPVTPTA